jgi:ABC-type multidrug transport system ATPase subunit
MMGVCPQSDGFLVNTLSGREHLRLFAAIKGLDRKTLQAQVLVGPYCEP